MGRKRTGAATQLDDGRWQPLVSVRRRRVRLVPVDDEAEARRRSLVAGDELAELGATVDEIRPGIFEPVIVLADGTCRRSDPYPARTSRRAALADAVQLAKDAQAEGLRRRRSPSAAAEPSDEQARWLEAWFADRDRYLTSRDKAPGHFWKYVAPVLGTKHIRDWSADDLRQLVRNLDEQARSGKIAPKTALNAWASVQAACRAACRSKVPELRVRADNPAGLVEAPDKGGDKQKQFLFPDEVRAVLACSELALPYRRLVALSVYLYMRPGELRVLRWRDVDLDRGVVRVHRAHDGKTGKVKPTKTGHARDLRAEPAALELLSRMHAERTSDVVTGGLDDLHHLTLPLRKALLVAGVEREALHEAEATSKAMTFYDLRATGITWRAVRGDDPLRIRYDAGHRDFNTTLGYIRSAEAFSADAFGEVFAAARFGDCDQVEINAAEVLDILCEGGDLNPHSLTATGT